MGIINSSDRRSVVFFGAIDIKSVANGAEFSSPVVDAAKPNTNQGVTNGTQPVKVFSFGLSQRVVRRALAL